MKTQHAASAKSGKKTNEEPRYGYGARPFAPVKSTVLDCSCGGKYIKTRPGQKECLKCMFGGIARSRSRAA